MELGQHPEADQALRKILARTGRPEAALVYALNLILWNKTFHNLARAAVDKFTVGHGHLEPAITLFRARLAHVIRDYKSAVLLFEKALEFDEKCVETHASYSEALWCSLRFEKAVIHSERALEINNKNHLALKTRARIAYDSGDLNLAEELYRKATDLRPWKWDVSHSRGVFHILRAKFSTGWKLMCEDSESAPWNVERVSPDKPIWNGRQLKQGKLLIVAEQGFGDAIQMFRYVKIISKRVGGVAILCHPTLERLFKEAAPEISITTWGTKTPDHDAWIPMFFLPKLCAEKFTNGQGSGPYLAASQHLAEKWRHKFGATFSVGLAWAGNPDHQKDSLRSMDPKKLGDLVSMPGAQFYRLQPNRRGLGELDGQLPNNITDLSTHITDFADTAAIISGLDLVISVDTSVAHLAGALGTPVWLLLPYAADWRWLRDREDSPWYPQMRIFRQEKLGDWQPAIRKVQLHLASEIEAHLNTNHSAQKSAT